MSPSPDVATMVPGFEFLQNLVNNAGAALPNVGQWVAPTLDPHEIDKRIGELRTVQFWLEQNAAMLGTTIQALEVQRMTLATLKSMNVQVADLREALTIRVPEAQAPAPAATPAPAPSAPEPAPVPPAAAPAAPAGVVDPMQWWSALTRQFTEIAANAMRESAAEAAGATGAVKGAASAAAAAPAAGPARRAAKKATRKTAAAKRAAPPRRRSPAGG